MAAPRKTAPKTEEAPTFSDIETPIEPGVITEAPATDEGETAPDPGPVDPFGPGSEDWPSVDRLPSYPVNESGVPDTAHPLYPGDDVEFLLGFLEHLAPEQFDRAKQRFMQEINEERDAA